MENHLKCIDFNTSIGPVAVIRFDLLSTGQRMLLTSFWFMPKPSVWTTASSRKMSGHNLRTSNHGVSLVYLGKLFQWLIVLSRTTTTVAKYICLDSSLHLLAVKSILTSSGVKKSTRLQLCFLIIMIIMEVISNF